MSKCKFYQTETKYYKNEEKGHKIGPKPIIGKPNWCSHENSPLRKNEKGELKCNGDLNHCPINK